MSTSACRTPNLNRPPSPESWIQNAGISKRSGGLGSGTVVLAPVTSALGPILCLSRSPGSRGTGTKKQRNETKKHTEKQLSTATVAAALGEASRAARPPSRRSSLCSSAHTCTNTMTLPRCPALGPEFGGRGAGGKPLFSETANRQAPGTRTSPHCRTRRVDTARHVLKQRCYLPAPQIVGLP